MNVYATYRRIPLQPDTLPVLITFSMTPQCANIVVARMAKNDRTGLFEYYWVEIDRDSL